LRCRCSFRPRRGQPTPRRVGGVWQTLRRDRISVSSRTLPARRQTRRSPGAVVSSVSETKFHEAFLCPIVKVDAKLRQISKQTYTTCRTVRPQFAPAIVEYLLHRNGVHQ